MNPTQEYTIADLIAPLDIVVTSSPDKTLGSVLSQVTSSHEAVFVFNNDNEFVGLVSPYKTLYSSNYPYDTKISSILFQPPAIAKETPLYQVADYMLETKIYALPVLGKDGTLEGVITAKAILQHITDDPELLDFISKKVKPHQPITVHRNAIVKDVYPMLTEKGVSRIIVVDDEGDLAGIVSRGDLMRAFIKPTPKRRFPPEGTYGASYSFAGEKKFRDENPVSKYVTARVDTLADDAPKDRIVRRLISLPHHTLVLTNKYHKPTGFLSTRDLLQAVSQLRPEEEIPLIMKKPTTSVSQDELESVERYLLDFGKKLKKRMAIEKMEVATEEPKNRKGQTKEFNTTLIVTPIRGKALVAVTKQREFLGSIQAATALIEKQRRRKGSKEEETQQISL